MWLNQPELSRPTFNLKCKVGCDYDTSRDLKDADRKTGGKILNFHYEHFDVVVRLWGTRHTFPSVMAYYQGFKVQVSVLFTNFGLRVLVELSVPP